MTNVKQVVNFKEIDIFKRHSTSSLLEKFLPISMQIDKYGTFALFSLGVLGNLLSIIVWWNPRLRMRESVILSFVFISAIDLIYLFLSVIGDLNKIWSLNVFYNYGMCKIYQVIWNGFCFYSFFMVLAVCCQHIISLKNPDSYEYYRSKKWIYLIIILLAIVSILFSTGEGVFSNLRNENSYAYECSVPKDLLSTNKSYQVYYWLVKFFLTSILIVSISGMCILNLHRTIDEPKQNDFLHKQNCLFVEKGFCRCGDDKNGLSLTKTISVMGFYSVFITIPQLILVSLEPLNTHGELRMTDFEILADPVWERYFNMEGAKIIFNELFLSQFSIKIFIYWACNKYFRECFTEIFGLNKVVERLNKSKRKSEKSPIKYKTPNFIPEYGKQKLDVYPIPLSERNVTSKEVNHYKHKLKNLPTSQKFLPVKRITKERTNHAKSANSLEPMYQFIPRSKICKTHYYGSNKLRHKENNPRRTIEKIRKKEFHNVYSEFMYSGSSSSSSAESSPIRYVKNCNCEENNDSDTNSDTVYLKYKHHGHKLHQV